MPFGGTTRGNRPKLGGCGGRVMIAVVLAIISVVTYFSSSQVNPVTGEKQYVKLQPDQEVALGLQAAPEMAQQHGGLSQDQQAQQRIDSIGQAIVRGSDANKSQYPFEFHVLADQKTVNAFALPGGQIFMTEALLSRLTTDGQVAGVLGHEVGHVVGRHGAEHLAKGQLTQGLAGAAVIASYDPNSPGRSQGSAAIAMAVGKLLNMKYGRSDELESDRLGVRYMAQAGYNPESMLAVMKVLKEAGGGGRQPEFFSTHPDPENRLEKIAEAIKAEFPNGLPPNLKD